MVIQYSHFMATSVYIFFFLLKKTISKSSYFSVFSTYSSSLYFGRLKRSVSDLLESLFLVETICEEKVLIFLWQRLCVEVSELAESVELVLHLALERDALGARVDGGTVRRPSARAFFLDSVLINLSVLV
jgi:hypothetical protein